MDLPLLEALHQEMHIVFVKFVIKVLLDWA